MDDGLAEHLLIELSSRWNPDLENCIKEQGKVEEMRENIISLMQHYGASDEMIEKSLKLTLAEVMKLYSTGTESVKKIPPPPRTKDLRPLRYLDLCSTVRKVKKRRSSSISNKSNEVIDSIMMEPMETLSDKSNNNNQTTILKINKHTNTLIPLPCDFCTSGITTTHVCRHPCGDRRIENENKNICGLAFCILCCGEEGNRTRCKHHVQSSTSSSSQTSSQTSSSTKAATSTQVATSKTSTVNENADYYDIYTAIRVLDFDIARCQFVGFNLLQERVKEILKEKSEKKITSYIEYQKQKWKSALKKLDRGRLSPPVRETQKRQKQQTTNNETNLPSSSTSASSSVLNDITKKRPGPKKNHHSGPRKNVVSLGVR